MLEKHCVERIQVTLDGVGQINDASRMLHNGEGTFETIMENLSRRTTINIVVRSNISKRNMEHYGELYSYLVDFNKKYGTNLTLYPARMEVYHNSKTGKDEKLSQEEFFKYDARSDVLNHHPHANFLKRIIHKCICIVIPFVKQCSVFGIDMKSSVAFAKDVNSGA